MRRFFADASPCRRAAEKSDDRGALGAAITRIASGYHIGGDAALAVCRAGQCDEAPLAGAEVFHLDGIADGEDVGVAGAHVLVNANAAAFADFQPGRFCQLGVWTHADGEDHDIGGERLAGDGLHVERAAVLLRKSGDAIVEYELDSMGGHMTFDKIGDLLVERAEQLIALLEEGDVETEVDEVLGHLEADESAADHDGAADRLYHLNARIAIHAGEERRASFDPLKDGFGVGYCPHMEDSGQIDAGQWRMDRGAPGESTSLS